MSLHYLLDGYNIIHQMPLPSGVLPKLEDQRAGLIRFVENCRPEGSARNKVTVIFDGRSGIWGSVAQGPVKVIFAQEESADDRIKKLVEDAAHVKNVIVVSDDRGLRYAVRAMGARVMKVGDFLGSAKRSKDAGRPAASPGKHISKTVEHKITAEFEKIWIKGKKR